MLFLASFLALFFELVLIRYLSTEIRIFAYLKNLPLIASFLGLGLGMVLGKPPQAVKRLLPLLAAVLFLVIAYAPWLHLTHLPFPTEDYYVWGSVQGVHLFPLFALTRYLAPILAIIAVIVGFFTVLGGLVGEHLAPLPPLRGYGINLAGSLAGILLFTLLAFLGLPPVVWILIGFLAAVPFFLDNRFGLVIFALILLAVGWPRPNTYWSPYYDIELAEAPAPEGWGRPSAYFVNVNHDYHQKMVDLSSEFLARYPRAYPNAWAYSTYELPYWIVPDPGEVLVVGAGTGNDVAAALRHGATHVDAVEIDPVILEIGKKYHPERPYDSPRVTAHVDDARAYFKKTKKKYDLIVFGYLDSHTLLTSLSSVRLDNYVYTLESFEEAKRSLKSDGTLVMAFAGGKTFVTTRLYATLSSAFGAPPQTYQTSYDGSGVVFVEGRGSEGPRLGDFPEAQVDLSSNPSKLLATDHWPFLYLSERKIPVSILMVLIPFLVGSAVLLYRALKLPGLLNRQWLHLFFLGAGFLLLEAKGVTEVALLFGSTWVVNSVVIGAFLVMALAANALIMVRPIPSWIAYAGLFVALGAALVFPYSMLGGLPVALKIAVAAMLVGLPVFFSGMVFSRSFRDVAEPSKGLGVNLLGAVIGGSLENAVMIGGTAALGWMAVVLYALSAVFLVRGTVLKRSA